MCHILGSRSSQPGNTNAYIPFCSILFQLHGPSISTPRCPGAKLKTLLMSRSTSPLAGVKAQAILETKSPAWWLDYLPQATARWLGSHVLTREAEADPTLLVDFLMGCSEAGNVLSADFYGCLQVYRSVSTPVLPALLAPEHWHVSV